MILYTMVPPEFIFPEEEQSYTSQQVIPCEAGQLIVERLNASEYRIVRLLSGDPMHYLNEKYTPGTVIQAKPQF
ncbi:YlzJ-like family protein [Alkalihalobacillus oceani]|uniref:YlzJ-like family protein n=1 Tax=Halalkalibacter oceani TaxID=1653776 RepID=A0A9X2DMZ1_9BACI|nr:YlzJ-like family protein [Halalkalibacter oceani]MCM3713253.1 YlzJ-like family protein [Halalkalibacter oceani]